MDDTKYPFKPGLSLDQAREVAQQIKHQFGKEIAKASDALNSLGHRSSYSEYTGRR
jgi:hypothetical protein